MNKTANRTVDEISMFNPLREGDIIELSGKPWRVDRSSYGWYLMEIDGATVATRHPTIHSMDGAMDFMAAIIREA